MEFRKLEIEKNTWGTGELKGSVCFSNEKGRIQLKLKPEHINKIFEVVADTMIETAREAAQELTCNIIEHKASLENKD